MASLSINDNNVIYTYKSYNFVTSCCKDIEKSWFKYAENNIPRCDNIIEISNKLLSIKHAEIIEKSIFEYSLQYCFYKNYPLEYIPTIYNDKYTSILQLIDSKDIKINIVNKIFNDEFFCLLIAFLPPHELCPENWAKIIEKKNNLEKQENKVEYSSVYKCMKCGNNKCIVRQVQLRSADEPMTTFVKCSVCNKTYKF